MFAFFGSVGPRTTPRNTRARRNRTITRPTMESLENRLVLDAAGSTIATALNIGDLGGRIVRSDTIGFFDPTIPGTDTIDFYRFSVSNPGSLNVVLNGLSADADLQVLNSVGTIIGSSANGGTTADTVNLASIAPGTYYARVNQFRGATSYNLTLTPDFAGNSTAAARNLGTLNGRQAVSDFVGGIDTNDFYRINLAAPGALNVVLNGLGADADLQVLNGAGAVIGSSANGGTTPETINLSSLAAGTYFVRVNQFSGDTNYNLTLTADFAGNSTAAARNLGTILGRQSVSDFVGGVDTNDFYRITLGAPGALNVVLNGLGADADLQVLNGAGAVIGSSFNGGTTAENINLTSLAAGTYFVRVNQFSGDTNYNLTLTADYAGNSTAAARNLGALFGTQIVNDFVGSIDTLDFYRINLTSTRALHVLLNGLGSDADLQVLNGAGVVIGSSANGGTNAETINFASLAAGTYFVRVNQFVGDTNYTLSLTS